MFKAIGRSAAKNILFVTANYFEENVDQQADFRFYLGGTLRPVLGALQNVVDEDDKGNLFALLNALPFTVERMEAAKLCEQHLRQAKHFRTLMGENPSFHVQKFLSGFFRLIFLIPNMQIAANNAANNRMSKEFQLLESYLNFVQIVFKDNEHLLLSDEIDRIVINSGLGGI